ncbi:MAG TPA: PAS domain S-box protein [Flavitalea sp.]|nr:PAS domain S-box protein [Flavitalea sp.]
MKSGGNFSIPDQPKTKSVINRKPIVVPDISGCFLHLSVPFAIVKDADLNYIFTNEPYNKLYNLQQITGKKVEAIFGDNPSYVMKLRNAFSSGNTFHHGQSINNNPSLYFNLLHLPFKNSDGVVDGIMIIGEGVGEIETNKDDENAVRFRNIVENSTDAIVILIGEDLVLDVANDTVLNLWGVNKDAIGKPFLEILPEMKEQGFHELLMDVYTNGVTHYGHETAVVFKRPNGSSDVHYFNFVYQPYREENGIITGVLVIASDVTEKILVKRQLEKSQTNFRNMILQAPVAMCVLRGPEYIVEIANNPMFELWGKKPEEVLNKPIFQGLPEAQDQGFEQLLHNVYTRGQRFQASERPVQLPRNGINETIYINFVYEPYYEGDGTISGIIAVAIDVTDQVLSRRKVEFTEENARLAIESAELGTYEINLLTDEMFTSPRFNAVWGFDEPTTDRSKFASVIHPDDLPAREEAHKNSIITGNLHYEARIILSGGSYRWVKIKGKVLYNAEHTPVRLLGVIQDITEQRQFAYELEKKVEERTKALKESYQLLKQTNEELEQFAYVTSHDLQEPLRKIRFYTNYVLDSVELEEANKKFIERINASAQRMSGLIQSLLEYSRISQKSQQFEPVDLNVIVAEVISDFELLIQQKQADIRLEKLPVAEAIPLQMNQLFFNLIGNALKFTRRNVIPVIEITSLKLSNERKKDFSELDQAKEYVQIQISDNGIGFNEEYADRIFTIFQRLNESSTYGGYGIGLALCKKIIANHSGSIYAKSKSGDGASFIFILPCIQTNKP